MAKKRHTPEQVINKLREAEVAIAEGSTVAEAARRIGETSKAFTFTAVADSSSETGESVVLALGDLPADVSAGTTNQATVNLTD